MIAESPGGDSQLEHQAQELAQHLERHASWFVLTGAGCSTESGIPAYRDESGVWRHKAPIQLRDFMGSEAVRQRYWARSFVGFERVQRALPNSAHRALAQLERLGHVRVLVTQNVDRLHQKAGSRRVIDLHGQLAGVACTGCGAQIQRERMQLWLAAQNPGLGRTSSGREETSTVPALSPAQLAEHRTAPDGDAELELTPASLHVPACPSCAGVLKPDVVFYGETVPPARVSESYAALAASDAVLVVGSSLTVFSGYRFVRRAAELGLPIVVLNKGATRGDRFAALKLEGSCGALLADAVSLLEAGEG